MIYYMTLFVKSSKNIQQSLLITLTYYFILFILYFQHTKSYQFITRNLLFYTTLMRIALVVILLIEK